MVAHPDDETIGPGSRFPRLDATVVQMTDGAPRERCWWGAPECPDREARPEVILIHPYEGGHPDHDAAAFAVHVVGRLLERERGEPPLLIEFTSYHIGEAGIRVGEFLASDESPIVAVELGEAGASCGNAPFHSRCAGR